MSKAACEAILGREVGVEATKFGKFICKFVDFDNPHPSRLVGDTEEIAYQNLLEYLRERENPTKKSVPAASPSAVSEPPAEF